MTSILYVHDHKFLFDGQGGVYSDGKIGDKTFLRFLAHSSSLSILSRQRTLGGASLEEGYSCYTRVESVGQGRVTMTPLHGETWFEIFVRNFFVNLMIILRAVTGSDMVVLRCPCFLSIPIYVVCRIARVPFAVEMVGDPLEALRSACPGGSASFLLAKVFSWITKRIVANARGVIYVTDLHLQASYPALGVTAAASNVEIDSIDEDVLHRRRSRILKGDGRTPIIIGVIGSFFNSYKGIDILVRALSLLKNRRVALRILGEGNRSLLDELAAELSLEDRVLFDGVLTKDKVLSWLDDVDIYCQPSRTEGLPRALVEAMSRGCPAVGTTVGGIGELLAKDWLVPPNDARLLASRLDALIQDPEAMLVQAERNFLVAKNYSLERLEGVRYRFWKRVIQQSLGEV